MVKFRVDENLVVDWSSVGIAELIQLQNTLIRFKIINPMPRILPQVICPWKNKQRQRERERRRKREGKREGERERECVTCYSCWNTKRNQGGWQWTKDISDHIHALWYHSIRYLHVYLYGFPVKIKALHCFWTPRGIRTPTAHIINLMWTVWQNDPTQLPIPFFLYYYLFLGGPFRERTLPESSFL